MCPYTVEGMEEMEEDNCFFQIVLGAPNLPSWCSQSPSKGHAS